MSDFLQTAVFNSPIGWITIQAGDTGVSDVTLLGLEPINIPKPGITQSHPLAKKAAEQILQYLEKQRTEFEVPLDLNRCTAFQRMVLTTAQKIPFGRVLTYGQLASSLGKPNASRAIGGAMAHNPIPILIPCHRVVAANGALTGFSAADGIRTKKWLLELEGHQIVDQKLD